MTTKTRRASNLSPAGDAPGDEPEVVTPPPNDGAPPADDAADDEPETKEEEPTKKEPKKSEPQPERGFFAAMRDFWWDQEIR